MPCPCSGPPGTKAGWRTSPWSPLTSHRSCLPWIRSGKVAATIYQRPLTQGQIAVQLLYRYLQTRVLSTPLRQIVAPYAVMNSNLNIVLQRLDIARTAALAHERADAAAVVSG